MTTLPRERSRSATPSSPLLEPFPPEILSDPTSLQQKVNFTALTQNDTHAVPPDSMGAVGPTQYIAFCNGRVRSFSKATGQMDGILDMTPNIFFSPVLQNGYIAGDPRIRYDRKSAKWFVIMLGFTSVNVPDQLMIAVSHTGIITKETVWSFFYFWPNSIPPIRAAGFADFPTLGIDKNALYIGVNAFYTPDFRSDAFVIPKKLLISGTLHVTAFRDLFNPDIGNFLVTPQGVDNFDSDATDGYFIGVDGSTYGRLILQPVQNPGTLSPQLAANIPITTPLTAYPLDVPHKGNTGGELDGLDDRLCNAHIRNKHLYTSHATRTDSQGNGNPSETMTANGCRWYEIDLTNPMQPALVQTGTLYDPSTTDRRHFWTPSVMTNGLHTAVLGCSTAGILSYIDAAFSVRYASDPLGSLRPPTLYTASQTAYNPPGNGVRRWGDYSHVSLDPGDNLTLWTIQEFCDTTNIYGCRVVALLAAPPPEIISCTPNVLMKNVPSTTLTITGNAVNGSAFYDPPSDFSKHLSVRVGDLPILSFTVMSSDQIQVVVSTMGVKKGPKPVVIKNPDGQKTSARALLTVH